MYRQYYGTERPQLPVLVAAVRRMVRGRGRRGGGQQNTAVPFIRSPR